MTHALVQHKKIVRRINKRKVAEHVERKWQEAIRGEPTVFLGICSTCNHAPTCSFRRDTPRPVLECDEFDDHVVPSRATRPNLDLESQFKAVSDEEESGQYKGLCVNCEVRKTCTLRTPGDSIWHCEEYV